ncbi:hypothetical protein BTO18_01740 [Polaribacter porphyrae]|uniref:Uncharacterized protein n=1 Tax=Polaribacter porphyrae TaxID=1137780 RepID=A0A2S7WK49_9FLAO|nr:hypothetical protein BTO18_01740 [Polaribacter porphyrae]
MENKSKINNYFVIQNEARSEESQSKKTKFFRHIYQKNFNINKYIKEKKATKNLAAFVFFKLIKLSNQLFIFNTFWH